MKFKKGLILIVLVLAILIPFSLAEQCYIPSAKTCETIDEDFTLEMCENTVEDGGAEGKIAVDECDTGCCCEFHQLDDSYTASTGYFKETCTEISNNLFFKDIPWVTLCEQQCQELTDILQAEGGLPACMDSIDNDEDGLIDMADIDCLSKEDTSEHPSAEDTECSNTVDEDGDGLLDYFGLYEDGGSYSDYLDAGILPDPCCTKEFGVSELCDFPECDVGNNTELCTCGGNVCGFPWQIEGNEDYDYENKKDLDPYSKYVTGSYCCNGQCSFTPCGDCIEGQETFKKTAEGLETYTCECDSDGVCAYGEPVITKLGFPEYCIDSLGFDGYGMDEDEDNKPNCLDTDCFGVSCSNEPLNVENKFPGGLVIPPKTCSFDKNKYPDYFNPITAKEEPIAYYDANIETWVCCFPDSNKKSRVKDCNDDSVPDTCGECACLNSHKEAQQLTVDHVLGKQQLNISYFFACQHEDIRLKLMRCDNIPAQCGVVNGEVQLENSNLFTDISDGLTCDILDNGIVQEDQENCLTEDGLLQPGLLTDFVGLFDNNIQTKKHYTYIMKSIYPDGIVSFSDPVHIETGNNQICFDNTGHFCIRDEDFHEDSAKYRYYCDDNNDLHGGQDADDEYICNDNEVCVEYLTGSSGKETTCQTKMPCIFCGSPFNTYGFIDNAMIDLTTFPDGFMELNKEDFNPDCTISELCYYDYTDTIKDAYEDCSRVDNCYDYRSEDACQGYAGEQNNKCLTHSCTWNATKMDLIDDLDDALSGLDINVGYCHDPDENVKNCQLCNKLSNNEVFAYCSIDMCRGFTTDDTDCYFNSTMECDSSNHLTCTNYNQGYPGNFNKIRTDCLGEYEQPLVLDIIHDQNDKPIWGTNAVKVKGNDLLGFGVCDFDESQQKCFKDGNDDNKTDPKGKKGSDITPPVTEVIAPANSDKIELKFAINDPIVDGRYHSDPEDIKTYYCFPSDNHIPEVIQDGLMEGNLPGYSDFESYNYDGDGFLTEKELGECYPNNLYKPDEDPLIPNGNGYHKVFYYSIDEAKNIEEVKSFLFNVDIKPPEITITPYVTNDLSAPYDDTQILFSVELDESAKECYDIFEDYVGVKEINYEGGQYFQAKYTGLKDASYLYTVVCTDFLDNTINKSITVKIDADQEIQSPQPTGVLDYSPVNLEIITLKQGDCRFGQSSTFALLTSFGEPEQISTGPSLYKYTHQLSLEEQGLQKYRVMCQFPGLSGEREDEIQFVLDTTPPTTRLTDPKGNDFNTSQWYSGEHSGDMAYLQCVDEPEFGFGCDELQTHYCLQKGSLKCPTRLEFPGQEKDTSYPLYTPVNIPNIPDEQWLCYHSGELTDNNMGGLIEDKTCVKLLMDSSQGPDINVPLLKQYTDLTNPFFYGSPVLEQGITVAFLLEGEVIDGDAATSPPDNKLNIQVYPLSEDYLVGVALLTALTEEIALLEENQEFEIGDLGASELFEDIPSNNAFSQEINLMPGLNKILLEAVDRSGEWTSKEYYIMVSPFNGELLEILEPPKGVSKEKEFDLIVKTSDDLPPPEKCMLSQNKNIGYNYEMEQIEPRKFKNHFNLSGMISGIYYTTFIRCDFPGGISDETFVDIIWDNSAPAIAKFFINPSDGKEPPAVVEPPFVTNLTVVTDDKTRCKYSKTPGTDYFSMTPFDDYETKNLSYVNEHKLTNLIDGQQYTYYVRCDNGPTEPASTHISEESVLTFMVDTTQFTGFELITPEKFTSDTSIDFELHTTKQASDCTFGPEEETVDLYLMETVASGVDAFKVHYGGPISLLEGEHTFYFKCLTLSEGHVMDNYKFSIDVTPPSLAIKTDPYTSSLSTLSASWEGEEEYSEVEEYNYSIGTEPGLANIYEWDNTADLNEKENNLNLSNETTYYWNVIAMNSVGLWSDIVSSNGTYVDSTYNPGYETFEDNVAVCANSIKDLGESDLDCGGNCGSCSNGKNCEVNNDCVSSQCISGICVGSSCDDGILNQQEADIDCGGPCISCDNGMDCDVNSDCSSGYCNVGTCQQPTCDDGIKNGVEIGVDCGGSCLGECDIPVGGEVDEDCYDGIKNQDEEGIDCGGACSNCEEAPEPVEPKDDSSFWWVWLILLLIITGLAGGGYYYYQSVFLKHTPLNKTQTRAQQIQQSQRTQQPQQVWGSTKKSQRQRVTSSISPTKSTLQSISQSLGATSNTFSKPSYSKRRQQKQNKRNAILKAFDEKPKKNESKIKLKLKDLDDKSPKTKKK